MSAQKKVHLRKDFLPKLISDGEQKNAIFQVVFDKFNLISDIDLVRHGIL